MTRASVVVPSRGGAGRLPILLRALERQTHPDWEVIVVVDGDIDGSAAVLDAFSYLPLRVIVFPENRGRVTALNAGFEAAAGDILIRADDDFEPSPGHVAAHVHAHEGQPVGVVGLPRNVAPDSAYLRAYGAEADRRFREYAASLPAAERWRLWGGNVSVTRETYDRLGGYDTSYRGYGWEDVDFGYRLHRLGLPVVLVPDAEVTHHMAAVTTRIRVRRAWESGRARAHFEDLHGAGSSGRTQPGDGAWNRLVRGAARAAGPRRLALLSRAVDRALPVLPAPWGRKAVALLVEAASVAGFVAHHGADVGPAVVFMPGVRSGGGAERYAVALAVALAEDPARRVILATTGEVDARFVETHFGIGAAGLGIMILRDPPPRARRLPQALFDLLEDWTWARQVRRLRPSLFINGLYRSEIPGLGGRSLYVCHFPHRLVTRWNPWTRHLYMRAVAAVRTALVGGADFRLTYDAVIANSQFTAGHVRERWGLEAIVVHPPCAPMWLPGVRKEKRIIAVGRIEPCRAGVPNKRLDALVSAFAGMTDLHAEGWSLDIVGACAANNRPYLAELVRMAGGAPVRFHPDAPHEELRRLYTRASLYWHAQGYGEDAEARPETQEHFGITTVEAMSAGCVPVVIDTAGPREVVQAVAGVGRWTTLEELAVETRRLAALPPAELEALARACRARAEEFSHEAFAARVGRLCDRTGEVA